MERGDSLLVEIIILKYIDEEGGKLK